MLTPKVGFVVYGTHRGVDDPMGQPFIDQKVIDNCKKALKKEGLELVETSPIVVDRADANKAILPLVKDDSIDAMILFSGTWIWAGEMIGAIREFAKTGKGVLARVCRENGKFALVVTRAEVKVPAAKDLKKRKLECGIPFWPHAFVYPQCDIEELLQHWHNEYACLGYGEELYDRLVAFGELTGMKVYAL